jgi:hypothetical protein
MAHAQQQTYRACIWIFVYVCQLKLHVCISVVKAIIRLIRKVSDRIKLTYKNIPFQLHTAAWILIDCIFPVVTKKSASFLEDVK